MNTSITREGGFIVARDNSGILKAVRISDITFVTRERTEPPRTHVGTTSVGTWFDCSPGHLWNLMHNWEKK